MWNLDGSTGGLGTVALTDYGSYASSLTVAQNDSPRYDRARYAMPAAPSARVALRAPGSAGAGQTLHRDRDGLACRPASPRPST